MKIFGRDLFTFKNQQETMYDFARWGFANSSQSAYWSITDLVVPTPVTTESAKKPTRKKKQAPRVTPKGLYEMKALNDNAFAIHADEEYIKKHVMDARLKLGLMYKRKHKGGEPSGGAERYGREELQSIVERLENRRRVKEFKDMLEQYPHTTNALIGDVLKKHGDLRCHTAEQFVPDFPREAILAMDEYNQMCQRLCGKKSVFYVIADKEDFGEVNRRRDPILLAQSPFGFFWQILGAWDKEMVYLGDL